MRWFHESIDRLHVRLMQLVFGSRAFRHGVTSPPFHEHLAAVQMTLPQLTMARRGAVTAPTLVGELEAGWLIRWGPRPEVPVVIYHHGIAEMPAEKSFWGLFPPWIAVDAHLVAIRAPFHRSWRELKTSMTTLSHFLAMCAVSVRLMEAIRNAIVARGARGNLMAGSSLGGVVALLHHLAYGTADRYAPLVAGPDVAHVILETPFRCLLAPQAYEHAASVRQHLDFRQALQASETVRLAPILARYDRDMVYRHQQAGYTACGVPVVTIERGHITTSMSYALLRAHLLACLETLPSSTPEAQPHCQQDEQQVSRQHREGYKDRF